MSLLKTSPNVEKHLVVSVWVCFLGQILQKDQEIKDLKQKIAEVMAVMPSVVYSADTGSMTPVTPHYSSKFMDTSPSGLDPNASVYQPLKKWMLVSHLNRPTLILTHTDTHTYTHGLLSIGPDSDSSLACLWLRLLFCFRFFLSSITTASCLVRRMLYCVTVFVVVKKLKTKKRGLLRDVTRWVGNNCFFSLVNF